MNKTESVNEKLKNKVQEEYKQFINHLKSLSPEEIIDKSYEKVFKEDLSYAVQDKSFSYKEAKTLLSKKYPLDALYQRWLDTDMSYMDMLNDIIDDEVNFSMEHSKRKNFER